MKIFHILLNLNLNQVKSFLNSEVQFFKGFFLCAGDFPVILIKKCIYEPLGNNVWNLIHDDECRYNSSKHRAEFQIVLEDPEKTELGFFHCIISVFLTNKMLVTQNASNSEC
jgi:hypothetical protein